MSPEPNDVRQRAVPLTLSDLKSRLWNCAEILRGSAVDRTDWKAYILPLLFFKRICDVWDEETAEAAEVFGDVEIRPTDIRGYAAEVAKRPGRRRNGKVETVRPDTVRLALAPLRALLATAYEDELIASNPMARMSNLLPARTDELEEKVKALTEVELSALLAQVPDEWRLFFSFLAETGLRIGEATELRWGDLDLGTRQVAVARRVYRGAVAKPKGRKTRRVKVTEQTARALWSLRGASKPDGDLVFVIAKGSRIDPSNLMRRVLKPAAVAADVGDWVGFHTFRHTCATRLFRGGWNAVQVQKFLGHSDPGFTMRRYVHLLDDDLPEPLPAGGQGGNGLGDKGLRNARTSAGQVSATTR